MTIISYQRKLRFSSVRWNIFSVYKRESQLNISHWSTGIWEFANGLLCKRFCIEHQIFCGVDRWKTPNSNGSEQVLPRKGIRCKRQSFYAWFRYPNSLVLKRTSQSFDYQVLLSSLRFIWQFSLCAISVPVYGNNKGLILSRCTRKPTESSMTL